MRKMLVAGLVALLIMALAPGAQTQTTTLALGRVSFDTPREGRFIASHFDETHVKLDHQIEVLLWPGDAARLSALGFAYEVITADLLARDLALEAATPDRVVELPGPDRSTYRVLGEYVDEMHQLADENPDLVGLIELPRASLEGRTVYGVEISAGPEDGRPTFYVDGVHHAREWPAAEYPMIFAHYLVDNYGENRAVTDLLERARVIIVPIVNVDGFDFSRSSPEALHATVDSATGAATGLIGQGAYWRKNRRSFTGVTVPAVQKNPDAYGVDPNRNYSWHWDSATGSSSFQVAQTYHGAGPFSEPESTNVQKVLLSHNVTGVVSNHTYSRLVIRPWGDTQEDAPDEAILEPLGAAMAAAMGGYSNIKGLELYATTGTTSDYGYGVLGALSYTFEHGRAFHPPYSGCSSDCVEKDWKGVMAAYMILADAAADPRYHSVVMGRVVDGDGQPVVARLAISKKIPTPLGSGNATGKETLTERLKLTLRTNPDGTFEWHLNPSTQPHIVAEGGRQTYTLTVTAEGAKHTVELYLIRGGRLDLGKIEL